MASNAMVGHEFSNIWKLNIKAAKVYMQILDYFCCNSDYVQVHVFPSLKMLYVVILSIKVLADLHLWMCMFAACTYGNMVSLVFLDVQHDIPIFLIGHLGNELQLVLPLS